jgi:hypothetical protein
MLVARGVNPGYKKLACLLPFSPWEKGQGMRVCSIYCTNFSSDNSPDL